MKGDNPVRLSAAAYSLVSQRATEQRSDRRTVASRAILAALSADRFRNRLRSSLLSFIGGFAFGYLLFGHFLP